MVQSPHSVESSPTSRPRYHKEGYVRPQLEITDKTDTICVTRYSNLTNISLGRIYTRGDKIQSQEIKHNLKLEHCKKSWQH
jgi:hypothetical protein